MQKQSASGLDTRALLPVYTAVFFIWSLWRRMWIMAPSLRNTSKEFSSLLGHTKLWLKETLVLLQKNIEGEIPWDILDHAIQIHFAMAVFITVLLVISSAWILIKREKSIGIVKMAFFLSVCFSIFQIFLIFKGNIRVNELLKRDNNFMTLTIQALFLPSSWVYARLILSSGILLSIKKLLVFQEGNSEIYVERTMKKDAGLGKRTKIMAVLIFIAIPLVIFFGIFFLDNRSNVFIGFCIAGLAMVPFFMVFEDRKPQAREIILIAVMAALAVAGRVAFFMIPQFKPVTAIVIIAGVGLGAEAGFLTGALAGFVSNFFFGQGPWTPWQMLAFGMIGFFAGILFRNKGKKRWHKFLLCAYGGAATFIIYGFIMDTSSVLQFSQSFSGKLVWSAYLTGIPFNFVHGVSTIIFLYVLAEPIERKLNRIKKKYGILEA